MRRLRRLLFVTLVVALVAAPLVGWAQPTARVFRIGYLGPSTLALEGNLVEAFRERLRTLDYMEGRNLVIEYRWADGQDDRLPALATELVRLNPDVIVATGTPGILAAKQATKTIPIVMASAGDPVRSGLVQSLARPGGNVTGFTVLGPDVEGKRLELLKQAVPRASRIAVLGNPANPVLALYYEQTQAAATVLRMTLQPMVEVRGVDDFERAFAAIAAARPHALVVIADRLLLAHRARIVEFAMAKRLPGLYPYREFVDAGGLISYAPSNIELLRGAAVYVDKILKGAKPGDLPVQHAPKFELAINRKIAKALGLTIPPALLVQADHIVE